MHDTEHFNQSVNQEDFYGAICPKVQRWPNYWWRGKKHKPSKSSVRGIHSVRFSSCKNRPAPFPGRISYESTKPGLFCHILACFSSYYFLLGPLSYVLLVFVGICSVFWLFRFSCQYLPSDWLERLLWGSLNVVSVSWKPRPKNVYDFLGLLYRFIVQMYVCLVPQPYGIFSYSYGTI